MTSSVDLRVVHSSPARSATADGKRPRSSGGSGESTKKKGLGLKEMEQTLSTLHKQNFDLKLELFHRRQRQTTLEEKVETLEKEKDEAESMNQALLGELEKRDKAVEEAVGMIVTLEARLEQLLREREMVRQVEEVDNFFLSHSSSFSGGQDGATPRTKDMGATGSRDISRELARMPSFLSERSENTENLRNVYLGVRGSVLSLPRGVDDARDGNLNGVNSPSLSVLSESSFLSIYGQKNNLDSSSPPDAEQTTALDGSSEKPTVVRTRNGRSSSVSRIVTPTRMRRSGSLGRTNTISAFSSINDVLEVDNQSPLQRLEKLEMTLTAMDEASRPPTQERSNHDAAPRQSKNQPSRRTKEEKREALRKVLTDAPYSKDINHAHILPPTPDTISTSTLTRYKNSNDTLSQQRSVTKERSYLALSESTTDHSASGERKFLSTTGAPTSQPASTSAFSNRREFSGGSYFEDRLPIPQRPRSADETTTSRHLGGNGWDSDSYDDFDDAASAASSFDYWMRESMKPNRALANAGHGRNLGRVSPDLFSFPSGGAGWGNNDMFAGGFMGSANAPLAPTLDALGASLPTPQAGIFGSGIAPALTNGTYGPPPPPNRRSSLHARTGSSAPGTPSVASRQGPVNVAPQVQTQDGQQKRHYPPNASQQTTQSRGRGLNNLFRRSIGSAPPDNHVVPASAPPTESSFPAAVKNGPVPMVGVPSWGRRADLMDDDRASATPPPIMRNRGPGRGSVGGDEAEMAAAASAAAAVVGTDSGLGAGLDEVMAPRDGGAPLGLSPSATAPEVAASNVVVNAQGKKRGFFGLGRVTSLRKGAP
ncbi:hypothetical protein UCRPA7_4222 [Phaeoacremonium minimum UCRPA7]|uniref:Centrosomin N-terminal motif 1 domain-containing protein n=1 Tax=Phaeoacremonium minimum (strain UCR-PA7) TaxID=1286976 RepID=R8BLU5_PHAM7|nr:hypothetical protein UCRPA7_4222 [Phaeoacremonium minimum UCRPA7]EOO00319.1 hypothetical protein UCRPA7_4222 [Phaeoacremonium minimum UCRPA7]